MAIEAVERMPDPGTPRMIDTRSFTDMKAAPPRLQAAHPVFIGARTSKDDERRVFDLLAGWALGSGGDLDRIGPNAVIARPVNCPPISLSRSGMASAVAEVFAADGPQPLSRDEEERLLPQAVRGSISAQRRLVDSYAELA